MSEKSNKNKLRILYVEGVKYEDEDEQGVTQEQTFLVRTRFKTRNQVWSGGRRDTRLTTGSLARDFSINPATGTSGTRVAIGDP